MKKRVVALLGAALLVASMSLTALAAPSTQAGVVTDKTGTVVDKDGTDITDLGVDVVVSDAEADLHFTTKEEAAVAEIQKEAEFKEILTEALKAEGLTYNSNMKLADVKEVTLVEEGTTKEGDLADAKWPIKITFKMNGITKNDKVQVLHYVEAKGAWQIEKSEVGDGTVTAWFYSLSPVAFVVEKAPTAPVAGEPVMLMSAIAAVAVGTAGIAASKKRR